MSLSWIISVENEEDLEHLLYHLQDDGYTVWTNNHSILLFGTSEDAVRNIIQQKYNIVTATPGFNISCPPGCFKDIWPSGLFSDITLVVDGTEYHVHKIILSTFSPYFMCLFTKMREASQSIIHLGGPSTGFKDLLDLIYGKRIPIGGIETMRLLSLVQYYQIKNINIYGILYLVRISLEDLAEYVYLLRLIEPNVENAENIFMTVLLEDGKYTEEEVRQAMSVIPEEMKLNLQ